MFGDMAASKVIYEQADEDDDESDCNNVSKNSDSLPLRKAPNISRVDGG